VEIKYEALAVSFYCISRLCLYLFNDIYEAGMNSSLRTEAYLPVDKKAVKRRIRSTP
jgi:hypothetical protein